LIQLDPYYRLFLTHSTASPNSTTYSTTLLLPDRHGVYTLSLVYKRPGLTFLEEKTTITVRHMAHDEYARSWEISSAWVYMTGLASIIIGWICFVAIWLWSASDQGTASLKVKKQQ